MFRNHVSNQKLNFPLKMWAPVHEAPEKIRVLMKSVKKKYIQDVYR